MTGSEAEAQPQPETRSSRTATGLGACLLALAALCWSGNHIVGRAMVGEVPPLATGSIRWIVPALLLAPFAMGHVRRDWAELRRSWRLIVALSLMGGAMFGTLQFIGLQSTTALNVSVLNSVAPVLIVGAGWLLFADRVSRAQVLGIAVSLAGVLAIIVKGQPRLLVDLSVNQGDMVILFNMGVWAVYSAKLRQRGAMHWVTFSFVLSVISAVATLPLWAAEHLAGNAIRPTPMTLATLAYVSVFPSLVAYAAWNRGVELLGSGPAGVFMHLIPLYSALLAGAVLGERIETYHLAGFALILAGVWLAASQRSARPAR